jgi:hypothetical protein
MKLGSKTLLPALRGAGALGFGGDARLVKRSGTFRARALERMPARGAGGAGFRIAFGAAFGAAFGPEFEVAFFERLPGAMVVLGSSTSA